MASIKLRSMTVALLVFVLAVSTAVAQGVKARSVEISGNGEVTNQKGADGKIRGDFGIGAAYNLTQRVAVGFDYAYLPLGVATNGPTPGFPESSLSTKEHLQLFGGMARFSLRKDKRVIPYLVVGGGEAILAANATLTVYGTGAGTYASSATKNGGYAGGGGGLSLYLYHGLGIRQEVRYERLQFNSSSYTDGNGANEVRGTVALFYQFGGHK